MNKEKAKQIVKTIDIKEVIKRLISYEADQSYFNVGIGDIVAKTDCYIEESRTSSTPYERDVKTSKFKLAKILTTLGFGLIGMVGSILSAIFMGPSAIVGLCLITSFVSAGILTYHYLHPFGAKEIADELGLTKQEYKALIKTNTIDKILKNEKFVELRKRYINNRYMIQLAEDEISKSAVSIQETHNKSIDDGLSIQRRNILVQEAKQKHKITEERENQEIEKREAENEDILNSVNNIEL